VFARADGLKPREIECAWNTARRVADITDFRFHDLRHTYASYLAMSGASLRDIAELLGHKKINQTLLYSHLLPPHTCGVVERMVQQYLPGETRSA
jgi:site-specific recombinase XerD